MKLRRLAGFFQRLVAPGYSCCHHCGRPWKFVEPHCVEYAPGSSIFFACTDCWPLLTGRDKVNYAVEVVHGSGSGWRRNEAWDFPSAEAVLRAMVREVMAS